MACEDPERTSNEKAPMSVNPRTNQPGVWPAPVKANRKGGVN
jgi:carboxypeptidase Q